MKLYSTLTRKIEEFKPAKDNTVSLYSCGPTVYDYPHIGNWRSFVFVDTLRRTLELNGYSVKHVMNITDVGHLTSDADEGRDKLEAGAEREGKSVWDVAKHYTDSFIRGVGALNILQPNSYKGPIGPYARATDFIEEQVNIIMLLLEKNLAYRTEQAIYFDAAKLPSYGELTGQKLEEKEVGARDDVVTDASKRHPHDFALWFFTVGRFADHQMRWPSPWGEGFPGWHLECSAIVHATLGDPVDIHTGGVDHIGTHHPNEMAQTEAAFGHKLANFWLHNEFVLVDGQKMAKSLGNFITLDDIIKKGYNPLALRLLFLQAHYRSQINFSWENLDAAQNRLNNLYAWADLVHQHDTVNQTMSSSAQDYVREVSDDLRTHNVLMLIEANADKAPQPDLLEKAEGILGLSLVSRPDISNGQKALIAEREKAREAKDWVKADELRDSLRKQDIEINDTPHGPVWSRT